MSEQPQTVFSIEKIYLKDLSLEIPNAPQVFAEQEQPKVDIKLHNEVRAMDSDLYEVVLTATVTAKHNEKTAFLIEVAQAGFCRSVRAAWRHRGLAAGEPAAGKGLNEWQRSGCTAPACARSARWPSGCCARRALPP